MDCIVLAGGYGTRIKAALGDVPKTMAPIGGKPFMHYLLAYLQSQGVRRVIIAAGIGSVQIEEWIAAGHAPQFDTLELVHDGAELRGTGGAARHALIREGLGEHVFIVNGDTLYKADLPDLLSRHTEAGAEVSIAVKPMSVADRYGLIDIGHDNKIKAFHEKKAGSSGLINGGIYLVDRQQFLARSFPSIFSFEKDYLEAMVGKGRFFAVVNDAYFIDIGVPEDYARAQTELAGHGA